MILDTNGLSAVADGDAALEPILRKASEVAVPVIVLGEYRYGIQQSRDRQRYEQWLTETICNYRVLDVIYTNDTAELAQRLSGEVSKSSAIEFSHSTANRWQISVWASVFEARLHGMLQNVIRYY